MTESRPNSEQDVGKLRVIDRDHARRLKYLEGPNVLFVLSRYIKGACFHPKEQIEQMTFVLFTVPMLH